MAKIVKLNRAYWPRDGYGHWCPGCGCGHEIYTDKPTPKSPSWRFDGAAAAPTFAPSVHIKWGREADPNYPDVKSEYSGVCHYFVRAGRIEFLGDCTHALKGQTVDMPDFPEGKWGSCERVA